MWRLEDLRDLPFSAVAQALSRLTREGLIEHLSKGVNYRNRATAFGKSRPNPASIRKLASQNKTLFPSGIAAANLLGFTSQTAKQGELATSALSLPRDGSLRRNRRSPKRPSEPRPSGGPPGRGQSGEKTAQPSVENDGWLLGIESQRTAGTHENS